MSSNSKRKFGGEAMQAKTDEATLARREYQKKWRAKNRDKVRAYNTAYWQRQAEKMKEAKQDAAGKHSDA